MYMWNKSLYLYYYIFYIVWFSPKKDIGKANNYSLLYFTLLWPKNWTIGALLEKNTRAGIISQFRIHSMHFVKERIAVLLWTFVCAGPLSHQSISVRERGGREWVSEWVSECVSVWVSVWVSVCVCVCPFTTVAWRYDIGTFWKRGALEALKLALSQNGVIQCDRAVYGKRK
jgi:hypothetical protein